MPKLQKFIDTLILLLYIVCMHSIPILKPVLCCLMPTRHARFLVAWTSRSRLILNEKPSSSVDRMLAAETSGIYIYNKSTKDGQMKALCTCF